MSKVSEIFEEYAENRKWSDQKQLEILLEFLEDKVKWNIFVDYMGDRHGYEA